MTKEQLLKMREWVRSEIESMVAGYQEDSDGHIGNNYIEQRIADDLFEKFSECFEKVR